MRNEKQTAPEPRATEKPTGATQAQPQQRGATGTVLEIELDLPKQEERRARRIEVRDESLH